MTKVITYGTYDLFHYGHENLLKRAKRYGDYLIVGVTSESFDRERGKLNVQQSLIERIEAVKATGIADEIIVEEYIGQKIDDVKRYGIDVFVIGSDWQGKFDYLKEYCQVVYLPRTEGISSSDIRTKEKLLSIGLVGESIAIEKFYEESKFVNGLTVTGVCTQAYKEFFYNKVDYISDSFDSLVKKVDSVYIASVPEKHYNQIHKALSSGKHVICEAPITVNGSQLNELEELAKKNGCQLMTAIKTAYSMAYSRLVVLAKSGIIGNIVSVDAVCTSLRIEEELKRKDRVWGSFFAWGPTAMLPVFQLLGTEVKNQEIITLNRKGDKKIDLFTKVNFLYEGAIASVLVGKGVKSEGELVVTGTEGYIYVPAPWWKTDYFEVRFENPTKNKRYFYPLEGEGIRYEQVLFLRSIWNKKSSEYISKEVTQSIVATIEKYVRGESVELIR